ncbi:MAG: mechanosensitive ion channel family protein [Ignavibacteria bacterium]|nr:mechanosensitive ion channel family protein [Ignavibacteria bacterium]
MNILEPVLGDTLLSDALSAALLIFLSYLAGRLLKILFTFARRGWAKRTKSSLDDYILTVLGRFITGLVVLITAYFATRGLIHYVQDESQYIRTAAVVVNAATYIMAMMYVAFMLAKVVDSFVLWYLKDVSHRTQTHLDDELAPLVNRVLNILVAAVVVIVVLDHFNQNISTLIMSLGVGSLAIALAAQETLANMIAGFVLMIDRPFRLSDRVRLPSGTFGNVHEIGMRSTKVIDDNNVMIITPNSEIVKSQIWNLSYPNNVVRFRVSFNVAYDTDIPRMQALLIAAINTLSDVVEPETTEVRMMELGESSIHCDALIRTAKPNGIPPLSSLILQRIHATLVENGIRIPFPQRVVHFPSAQTGDSRVPLPPQ